MSTFNPTELEPIKLEGKLCAQKIEQDLAVRVAKLCTVMPRPPALATILVDSDPASATYVKMKQNACKRVGIESVSVVLPVETTTQQLLAEIHKLNDAQHVHGILLQHPVPKQIDERACFDAIATSKDVDGVTTHGFGRMSMGERAFGSATPQGIMDLLAHYKIDISRKHAVVVGRSAILGKPMAMMLLNANATVTICHSHTANLPGLIEQAEIVVGAVGKPQFIKGDWIRDAAIVIDAGYHPAEKVGDIELSAVADRSFAFTPVPGGVGPMTIATLIRQTVDAAEMCVKV